MDLGHPASADQLTDVVPPAQQTTCAVHPLPPFSSSSSFLLPGPRLSRLGAGVVTTGGWITAVGVALMLGDEVAVVGLGAGVMVPPSGPRFDRKR